MVQTTDFAKQNKTKKSQANQNIQNSQPHNIERKHLFSTDPFILFQSVKRVVFSSFLFFFRESRDLLSFGELFKCNFPQGNGISFVPRIFRLPTRGSGRPLPLVGRRKTLGRGWSGIGHKNAKTNTRAQR